MSPLWTILDTTPEGCGNPLSNLIGAGFYPVQRPYADNRTCSSAKQMRTGSDKLKDFSRRCLIYEKIGYTLLMTNPTNSETTVTNIGVAMFSVADQDVALKFYTEKLGYEVRADMRFGEKNEMRWLEVAPPGSTARLALNPPMGGQPGSGGIGVETTDVLAEHKRLGALGVDVDTEPMRTPGAPLMFMMRDPDGNSIAVVEALAP